MPLLDHGTGVAKAVIASAIWIRSAGTEVAPGSESRAVRVVRYVGRRSEVLHPPSILGVMDLGVVEVAVPGYLYHLVPEGELGRMEVVVRACHERPTVKVKVPRQRLMGNRPVPARLRDLVSRLKYLQLVL